MPHSIKTDKGIVTVQDVLNYIKTHKKNYMPVKIKSVNSRLYLIHTDKDTFIQISTSETRSKK